MASVRLKDAVGEHLKKWALVCQARRRVINKSEEYTYRRYAMVSSTITIRSICITGTNNGIGAMLLRMNSLFG